MSEHRRPLLDVLTDELRLRNYSPNTIKAYRSTIRTFAKHVAPRHPRELSDQEIREYLFHLLQQKKFAPSTVNQVLNALRFLYIDLYRKPMVL